jgi:hypothetical protein
LKVSDDLNIPHTKIAVINTANDFIQIPKSYFDALKEIISAKESSLKTVPVSKSSEILMILKSCQEVENSLENFVFNIVNQKFIMKPKSYLHESKSGKQCYLGFSSSPDEENQFVLGNYFLHQFYTVLDYERNVIMIGRKQNGLEDSDMVSIGGGAYDWPSSIPETAPVVPEYVAPASAEVT